MSDEPKGADSPQALPAPQGRPDAVLYPDGWDDVGGNKAATRQDRVFDYLDNALGGPTRINDGHIPVKGVMHRYAALGIPGDPDHDTYLGCKGSPQEGQLRHRWVDQPNGCKFGYLLK